MIKKTILALAITLSMIVSAGANIMREVSESACRVSSGGASGSGTAVHEDEQYVYVLTNAHVVDNNRTATVEFWKYGKKVPQPIPGQIVWRRKNDSANVDFAIIAVSKSSLPSMPRIINFAPQGLNIGIGSYVITAGCPLAQWLSIKEGSVLRITDGEIIFRPVAENGQSGSGLFTRFNGKTYIAGVVTARTGQSSSSRDQNGFDINNGVAYRIERVRQALAGQVRFKSLLKANDQVLVSTQLWALDSLGQYWRQNADGSITVPDGRSCGRIVEWNLPPPQQRPPQQRPPNPGDQGYGNVPPNFGDGSITPPEPQENPLQKNLDDCIKSKEQLEKEKAELEQQLADKEEQASQLTIRITALENQVASLKSQLNISEEQHNQIVIENEKSVTELNAQLTTINETVNNLNIEIEQKNIEIQQYKDALEDLQNNVIIEPPPIITPPDSEPDGPGFWARTWEWSKSLNPLWWGLLGVGGTLLLGKYKIPSKLLLLLRATGRAIADRDDPQPQTQPNPDSTIDMDQKLRIILDKYFSQTEAKIAAKLGSITDYTSSKLNDIDTKISSFRNEEEDLSSNVVNTNINIGDGNNSDGDVSDGHGGHDGQHHHGDCDGIDFDFTKCRPRPGHLDRIKQFFDLKRRDGESVEQWAFYALLYREAMQLLRQGKFAINVVGEKITLQGQRVTAEKIDEWVRDQYIKRTSIDKLHLDYIYHEAMLGFLYKEAIHLLRNGAFPLLGAKETASVIENWVKREFLQRMGISL
jgi:hypothetical protein